MPEDFLSQFSSKNGSTEKKEVVKEVPKKAAVKTETVKKEAPVKKAEPVKEVSKKPDSFKEEERVKIVKEKKPVNKLFVAILAVAAVVLLVLSYFLFFAPKIEMPNFVGLNKSDVAAFVKQQEIETSGVIFKEEYDFNTNEGTILDQNVAAGKKIKNNAKLTFTVSLGADPNELVVLPDIESMDRTQIKNWIADNKLTKTKINTVFSETVELDKVISYELSGVEADSFTRSSTLKINVSKGPQPAGTITVTDFKDKSIAEVENWAKTNKIELKKVETFSAKVNEGYIISQSVEPNKTMKQGDTLTVYVSKGAGVKVPDLAAMKKEEADAWIKKNAIAVKEKYSDSSNYVLEQTIKANTTVASSDLLTMSVTINAGNGFYLADEGLSFNMSYDKLVDTVNELKDKGININVVKKEVDSSEDKGAIIDHSIYTSKSTYSDIEKLPLNVTFSVSVSNGKTAVGKDVELPDFVGKSITEVKDWANKNNIVLNVVSKYSNDAIDTIIEQEPNASTIKENSSITVVVSKGNAYVFEDVLKELGFEFIGTSYENVSYWISTGKLAELGIDVKLGYEEGFDDTLPIEDYRIKASNGDELKKDETIHMLSIEIIVKKQENDK